MFSFFKKSKPVENLGDFIHTDMHSHLLPGIDDGADDIFDSIKMLHRFVELGYKKAILTPHIMGDSYKNTPEGIREKLNLLKENSKDISIELEAAAEYYVDDILYNNIQKGVEILSFGQKKYVLIETSYINEASYLNHVTFELISKGFTPVIAHPERYTYMYDNFEKYIDLFERGLLFQLNINSLAGYYSPMAQKIAEKLIDNKMVHFLGTDCHSMKHTEIITKVKALKYYTKLRDLPLLNNSL